MLGKSENIIKLQSVYSNHEEVVVTIACPNLFCVPLRLMEWHIF